MKKTHPLAIIMLFFIGCASTSGPYTYDYCVEVPGQESQFSINQSIRLLNSTNVTLTGKVTSNGTSEPVLDAYIHFTNIESKEQFWTKADSTGYFDLNFPAGEYFAVVDYYLTNEIKENISFNTGGTYEMNVGLGDSEMYVSGAFESAKRLNRLQLYWKEKRLIHDILSEREN